MLVSLHGFVCIDNADVATVLNIPTWALTNVVLDFDQSNDTETILKFMIYNVIKPDGTEVDPVAAASYLKNLADNQARFDFV